MCENLKSSSGWSIKGLGATGPDPDLKDKLMLFGQFVGDWTIVKARYLQSDGTWASFRGEVHFGWILGGTAVQDVWIGCPEGSEKLGLYGTTVRFYDSKIDAWRSTWLSPLRGYVQTFIARQIGDDIVLEEKTPEAAQQNGYSPILHRRLFGGMLKSRMKAARLGCLLKKCI